MKPGFMRSHFFCFTLIFSLAVSPPIIFAKGEPLRKLSIPLPSNSQEYRFIRVSIAENVPQVKIGSLYGAYTIKDDSGHVLASGPKMPWTIVKADQGAIRFGDQIFHQPALVFEAKHGIRMDGIYYLNKTVISLQGANKLLVVNELDLEDYVKSVIAWEANPKWSLESLKAQAIVARTFALHKAIQNQNQKFDVSKGVLSQVYSGNNAKHARTDSAVDATRGQILTYRGEIFPAYYHSTCGGKTASAAILRLPAEVIPPLKGVVCEFCQNSPHFRWNMTVSKDKVEQELRKHGYPVVNGISSLGLADQEDSGRSRSILVTTPSKSKVKIIAEDFRIWMGADKFKSLLIKSIDATDGGFHFKGRGWGHGVGMCQFGMKYLGEIGYNAQRILLYYYPESEIKTYY
jgi:stage II sporulation protein D